MVRSALPWYGDVAGKRLSVFMGSQNDPGTHYKRLRRGVGTDELLKVLCFLRGHFTWISGFRTAHLVSPSTPTLSTLADAVKPGKDL
jgi:hypothetical protein